LYGVTGAEAAGAAASVFCALALPTVAAATTGMTSNHFICVSLP